MEINDSTTRHQALVAQANEAIANQTTEVAKDRYRLAYHLMPPAGWMNDPNGLICFHEEYHVFYQHHPYSAHNGLMHWGHARSKELVHWEHLPVAIAPSEPYEKDGCWSGSAVDDQGILTLVYSGNISGKPQRQVQCVATSPDGIVFTKYEGNPVIAEAPLEGSHDFRDPKVWSHQGHWYVVVGSGKDGKGKICLYQSDDLRHWTYLGVAAESDGTQGCMWECPDLFPLGDKHILILSPMGIEGVKDMYIIGQMDYQTGRFTQESVGRLDYGHDFYAPQTLLDKQGRRIMIAWMHMWGVETPTTAKGWTGAMTFPRLLSLDPDGTLLSRPVLELETLRSELQTVTGLDIPAGSDYSFQGIYSECIEIVVEFDLRVSSATQFGMRLRCSLDGTEHTDISFERESGCLTINREQAGIGPGGVSQCLLRREENGILSLHILLDRSSVEVFANQGRAVMSERIYPSSDSLGLQIFAMDGMVRIESLHLWKLA